VGVRTVGEGADKLFSLVDAARLMSGKSAPDARRDVRVVMADFSEVSKSVGHGAPYPFRCKYKYEYLKSYGKLTPFADLRGTLLVVLRLRSRVAQRLSAKVVDVFIRYVGGDATLAREVLSNREFQEQLAEKQPDHPARVFGETVERESRVPPPWQEFNGAPNLKEVPHLYALGSRVYPRLFKTGSGKNPWERLDSEERKHKGQLKLYMSAIWWNEGHLEHLARKHLHEMPPAELGIQGTEYRMTNPKEIQDATDAGRQQHRALSHTCPHDTDDEAEKECKRRRLHVQLCKEEFELHQQVHDYNSESQRRDFELQRRDFELHKMKRTFDIEMAQKELAFEEKRFESEKRKSSWVSGA
jgi:hypothetical protein